MRILTLNAGSSSLKASVVDSGIAESQASVTVEWGSDATRISDRQESLANALSQLGEAGVEVASLEAVGHRMVHGGARFVEPTLIYEEVLQELQHVAALAPLHNSVAIDGIRSALQLLPRLPHVAVFDTAFHSSLPEDAIVYPLPWQWYEEWGIRRYGFHGLSVSWAVRRAGELLGRDAASLSLVVAHLGSGCSVTAVRDGASVATSMGLTPLEGLMMGTRAGSFDPGIILGLLRDQRLSAAELAEALDHGAGLLGVSGVSGDVRAVSQAAEAGHQRAGLALAIFARRAAEGICAAAASLRRLDALVFTGGIGENAEQLRAAIVDRLAVLGVAGIAAPAGDRDTVLSDQGAAVAVLRVEAREDVVIAEAVADILSHTG